LRRESDQPLSRPAYRTVERALKTGKLIKLDECERCGSEGSLEAHHEDYSKPLDVEWLCTKCHGLERRKD
jgi:ribosomal protein S27AE